MSRHPQPNSNILLTADGSHTLFVPGLNEPYHSVHGAIGESMCVFVENGLRFLSECRTTSVFEVGFGTGLNAYLTLLHGRERQIYYRSIEAFPVPEHQWQQLNYPRQMNDDSSVFFDLHNACWNRQVRLGDNFVLHKVHERLEDYIFDEQKFQLVYFDAFAPDVHPALWQPEVFLKIAQNVVSGGVLVTYSTKGWVKRALTAAGFTIQKLPGPPGKREVLRAIRQ